MYRVESDTWGMFSVWNSRCKCGKVHSRAMDTDAHVAGRRPGKRPQPPRWCASGQSAKKNPTVLTFNLKRLCISCSPLAGRGRHLLSWLQSRIVNGTLKISYSHAVCIACSNSNQTYVMCCSPLAGKRNRRDLVASAAHAQRIAAQEPPGPTQDVVERAHGGRPVPRDAVGREHARGHRVMWWAVALHCGHCVKMWTNAACFLLSPCRYLRVRVALYFVLSCSCSSCCSQLLGRP